MGNLRECDSDPSSSTKSCSGDEPTPADSADVEPNHVALDGGTFRGYGLSTDDIKTWVWTITGLLFLTVPPLGLFIAGWLLLESIGTVDEKGIVHAPVDHSMNRSLLLVLLAVGSLIFGALFQFLLFTLLGWVIGY